MRVDLHPTIKLDGYEEFETKARKNGPEIQAELSCKLADGREAALDIGVQDSSVVSYINDVLKFIGPAPDQAQRKIAEKSFIFGLHLGLLLSIPDRFEFGTDNFKNDANLEDIQIYVNSAPREYLRYRPNVLQLIDRNLLQPVLGMNQAKLVRNMAGLAVMKTEEGRLDAFINKEEEKFAVALEALDKVIPDDWL